MTTREILLRLKRELENSINGTNAIKKTAIDLGNYQTVIDLDNQNYGLYYAVALIEEALESLID